ncbi:MAG: putative Ig domain-containing protein [Acidobacteriia bacterium]|nr:putative Ig domain-containing protein [Terriglobia bacterium]
MSFQSKLWIVIFLVGSTALAVAGQQAAATGEPLSIRTVNLSKANLRQQYRYRLEAQGGVSPLQWRLTSGSLAPGLALGEDGILSGVPTRAGEFRFTVTVRDSGKPVYERSQELVLRVVTPLLAEWSEYPKINGQRVEGAIKVSNGTDRDFDLTVIILAVNEIGRATAVGYQHVTLKQETSELAIPFGENLPPGAYEVNVDVVAEVPAIDTIYRARLVTKEKLQVRQGQ